MGAGKTTVGRELARQFSAKFIDLDAVIEAQAGRTVREIFASEGEPAFRRREREAWREVARESEPYVLAVGGGAFAQAEIAAALTDAPTVFLEAPGDELYGRCVDSLDAGVRPLLQDLTSFKKLYAERQPHYRRARWTVTTSGRKAEEVAAEIAGLLRPAAR